MDTSIDSPCDLENRPAALDNLSTFAQEAAHGIDGDVNLVVEGWTGNAADAMQLYFHHFSS